MNVIGFNRVELIVPEEQIEAAVEQFNDLLGTHLPRPHPIEGHPVLSATDFDGHIELVAPVKGEGPSVPGSPGMGPGRSARCVGDRRHRRGAPWLGSGPDPLRIRQQQR